MSSPNAEDDDDSLANSDSSESSTDGVAEASTDINATAKTEGSSPDGSRASSPNEDSEPKADVSVYSESVGDSLLLRRYQLLDEIGSGGVGTVYCARDTKLDRKVAIKVLHPDCLSNAQIARLHREAKIIGQINHPSVVDVYDFDITEKNEPVMVMEFLEGESLHEVLKKEGYLSIEESVRIFVQICDAMEHAHKRGLIHRDLKAGNIMLVDDQAKILDFGMAKDATQQDATITKVGSFVGTPSSISPEQASGEKVDHRTDIYSMGCLMYETLTGRSPFEGNNSVEMILKQINEPAPPLQRSDTSFPSDLQEIVARALKKRPGERFASMSEMKAALERTLEKYTGESEILGRTDGGTSTKSKPNLVAPLVVTSILAFVFIFIGYTIIGLESEKAPSTPPPPVNQSSTEKNEFFAKSEKNNQNWYTLSDPITPEKIRALTSKTSGQKEITHLNLASTSVTDSQLEELTQLPLDVIDLRKTNANDETLKVLLKCATLRSIVLDSCGGFTPDGLEQLRKLPDLRVLALADTGVNDKHVEAISKIETLRFIRLTRNPKVTDSSAPNIASIPRLISVAIGGTSIRKRGLQTIMSMPDLANISLKDQGLTDDEIVTIPSTLCLFDLKGNKISGKTIQKLCKIENLWFVDIRDCPGLTEHDSKALAMQLKLGEVWSDYDPRDRDSIDSEWYFEPTVYDRPWQDSFFRFRIGRWQTNFANPSESENFPEP